MGRGRSRRRPHTGGGAGQGSIAPGGGGGAGRASRATAAALLVCSGAALLGTATAFVGRVGPPCGSRGISRSSSGGGSPRGTGVVAAGGSLVQSPTPSYCNIASPEPTAGSAARRGGVGGLTALLLPGLSSSTTSSSSSSSSSSRIGWGGGGGGAWRPQRGRGAAGPLWMARRETWTDIPMNDFYNALATYIEEYGSTEVPEDFVVPVGSASAGGKWPERMQGLKLGKYFKKLVTEAELREQDPAMVAQLESELGIKVGLSDWDRFLQALTVFKEVKGNLKVLANFVVPQEAPWPAELWGYRLGVRVGNVRTTGRFLSNIDEATKEERVALLDELGFEWRPRLPKKSLEDLDAWFNPIVDALRVYARMGGDIGDIKPSFVIPDSIEWPESLRGMALGQKLAYLRSRSGILNDHPEKKETLQELGVLLSSREAQNEEKFQLILLALETFRSVHGHCNVPQSFIVPDSDVWPEETRGMRLGVRVNAIRSQQTFIKNNPKRRALLEELGFDTQPSKGAARRSLGTDYQYEEDDEGEGGQEGPGPGDDDGADGAVAAVAQQQQQQQQQQQASGTDDTDVGGGGAGGGEWQQEAPQRNAADDYAGRLLSKEEILEIQQRAGLEWYFVNRQPGQSWFEKVEALGLANYPFVPLLSAEQHVKTKQKGDLSLRGNRINPFFVIQPPALKQTASEVETYPTGSLLDTLAAESARAMVEEEGSNGDAVRFVGKLKEETQFSRIDYRRKLVPDDDVDKEVPPAWDEAAYWEGMRAISSGEMDEFGEGGSFEDVLHALELFKERYGHVDVPLDFEFESPSPEDDEDDWFSSWTGKAEVDDDWDSEAEPEFLKNAVSLSSTYDPEAAAARRERRMERRQRDSLAGLFEGDEEEEEVVEEGLDLAAIGSRGLRDDGREIRFDFEDEDEDEEEDEAVDGDAEGAGNPDMPTPDDDPYVLWPPEVEKMPLGDICFLLRSGVIAAKNVPERRAALDALGFDWGNEEAYVDLRWDVFLGTYYYWRLIKGVPLVPWEFVVPEEAPWPFFCRGVELGKMCDLIRQHQEVFFKYYPERVQTLEYFGWKWWWPTLEAGEEPDALAPYNRYNNYEGMDLVLKLGFVDGAVLEAAQAEAPDWDELARLIPESIPWRDQDHMAGREGMVEDEAAPSDMLSIPGKAKRRQQARAKALQANANNRPATAASAFEGAGAFGGDSAGSGEEEAPAAPVKRGRGRKPGSTAAKKAATTKADAAEPGAAPKKRGRKPKSETAQ